MLVRPALFAVALGLLLAGGCGPPKLNESKTYTLEPGDANVLDFSAIPKPQKITVEFTASAADVSVYLIKDFKGNDGLNEPPKKEQILESKQGKSGSFSVDVPANTATRVVVRATSAKTEVTVTVTNSK